MVGYGLIEEKVGKCNYKNPLEGHILEDPNLLL